MRRLLAVCGLTTALILASGCVPGAEHSLSNPQPPTNGGPGSAIGRSSTGSTAAENTPNSTTPAPASPAEWATKILQLRDAWGDYRDVQSTGPGWIGLDAQGHLAVGGLIIHPSIDGRRRTLSWFQEPLVQTVYVWDQWRLPEITAPETYTKVTRETYQGWPAASGGQLPFAADQWPKFVDLFAQANTPARREWKDDAATVQAWVKQVLGDRLLQLKLSTSGHALVTIRAQAGGLSLADRKSEVGKLAVVLGATTLAQTLHVDYLGADTGTSLEVSISSLLDFAGSGASLSRVQECIKVDGAAFSASCPRPDAPAVPEAKVLPALLAKVSELQALMPKTSGQSVVAVGIDNRVDYVTAIQATVSASDTWEQAWGLYELAVNQVFAATAPAHRVELTMQRGTEVEYFVFNRSRWVLRQMAAEAGLPLPPSTMKSTAQYYQSYQAAR